VPHVIRMTLTWLQTCASTEKIPVRYAPAISLRVVPGFHHYVAVLPLPFRRSRYPLPFPYTVAIAAAVAYLFAVYGCNGTEEFSYIIFTEQRNFTTAERRNGNGRTATE